MSVFASCSLWSGQLQHNALFQNHKINPAVLHERIYTYQSKVFQVSKRISYNVHRSRQRRATKHTPLVFSASTAALAATDYYDSTPFFPTRILSIIKQIAVFGLPAVMVPLADPLMSLVDTVALGQWAGSLQLAALGPCSLVFNFAFYSFTALSVSTVSLIAERLRKGHGAEHALSTALFLGATGGILISSIFALWGPQFLAATGCDPGLLGTSWKYLRIRCLAAPAAIITQVAQAGFLGQRDSQTPLKIVLLSLLVSLLGDVILIGGLEMGVAGAAWTTLAAQYLSAILLLRALQNSKVKPPLEFPVQKEMTALLATASTLGIFYIAKTTSYLFLQATATRLPALLLASHQPIWQLWGLASFTNTPLEQSALAFLPAVTSTREKKELITVLMSLGAISGILCSLIAHGIPAVAPRLLTADAALWPYMQSVWLPGTLALMACGLDVSATGVLLACKDRWYVARSMILSGSALVAFLHVTTNGALSGSLGGVWWGLFVFFSARLVQSLPRVLIKHLNAEVVVVGAAQEVEKEGASSSGNENISSGEDEETEADILEPGIVDELNLSGA
jgi:putative MATE family efflux protein